ncbi:MAG: hypothetical protein A2505_10220 [Deltaproteobacteria bacterium RIFOXYD12_FULL_55_16]|nr:MAG: hypothetical protein A2505_10220 [Deltaproteobacteria bacterium RIFOXYD12_FULL_55_16]
MKQHLNVFLNYVDIGLSFFTNCCLIFQTLVVLSFFVVQPALASNDQGFNDYAKAQIGIKRSCQPLVRKYESVCGANFSDDSKDEGGHTSNKYDNRSKEDACTDFPKNERPMVQEGQIISVTLQQAYIKDFCEGWIKSTRGEIAAVGRIAEQDSGTDFDFSSTGMNRGRLIYYSDGIQKGQFLNFSQLPIYGPIEYKGKSLLLEFHILELDKQNNAQVVDLLSAAANLGAKAYPPASPILNILETIGSGLLKAQDNDLEFRYHASLVSDDESLKNLENGRLEYGNYVFVKLPYSNHQKPDMQDKQAPWEALWFNQKNGRLYKDIDCSVLDLDHTYFTVQINRAKEEASLNAENTFANFMKKLDEQAKASVQEKVEIIEKLKNTVTEDKSYRDGMKLIEHAEQFRWGLKDKVRCVNALKDTLKTNMEKLIDDIAASLSPAVMATPAGRKFAEDRTRRLVVSIDRLIGDGTILPQAFDANSIKGKLSRPTENICGH